jgi:surfeit locus 1 family protein
MRPYFRPMLVPTLWIVPLLAMLLSLGVWQIHRLHWKLDLLEKIHTGLTAPPATLADVLPRYNEADIDNADYRRAVVHGLFDNGHEILFFTTGEQGAPVYHVLTPFLMEDGHTLLIDRGTIPVNLPPAMLARGDLNGERTVIGILRKPAPSNWFTPRSDVAHRVTHTRDPATLAREFGLKNIFPMFLEADAASNPGGWPKGGVTIVDLPNDHLQYAITWFGLALGLLAVYLAYHQSKGRLGWR